MSTTYPTPRLFIRGEEHEAAGDELVINPATEEPIAVTPIGDVTDADRAIAAAREAFDEGPWGSMSGVERSKYMERLVEAMVADRERQTQLMIEESGAPVATAGFLSQLAIDYMAWAAEMARRDYTESLPPTLTPVSPAYTLLGARTKLREPVGVVTAFAPFNSCYVLAAVKLASALAMGNTVVIKPAPQTPLGVLAIADMARAADLPPGVVNIVTGGIDVGQKLTEDPRVDMVSFTGSDAAGAKIMAQSASTLKRVLLELGGKSAMIVRADADLEVATDLGAQNVLFMAGQGCALHTRQLVHADIREAYVEGVRKKLEVLRVGDPADPGVVVGPLISGAQRDRVEQLVSAAVERGATLETGGSRPQGLERGYFYSPTIMSGVENGWPIAQEEVFGPVGVVVDFRTDEEAIRLANDTPYGLSGAVISRDAGTAWNMAKRLRTGEVQLNGGAGMMSALAPFGGYKRSGIGREYGIEGLFEYTQVKVVMFHAA